MKEQLLVEKTELDEIHLAGVQLGRKEILDHLTTNCEICDPVGHSLQGYWLPIEDYKLLKQDKVNG